VPQDPLSRHAELAPRQAEMMELLRRKPGSTIRQVADELGLSHTSASYKLRSLQKRGLVEGKRHGRTVRHYTAGGSTSWPERLAPILRDANGSRVLSHLREDPRVSSINQLAQRIGLSFSVMKATLSELAELGLVRLEHSQGRYRVHLTPALERSLQQTLAVMVGPSLELPGTPATVAAPLEAPKA
jgi:DNA-binding IclR family transcriptional regulator